ncbi:hypothetical protein LZ016_10425 [Sphingomonas sp. SM33]|jgi:hypothetical protein|uniref:Uncharacterized protein n=1 Tax=Sphingomonas telluris TaxID=2907998 RepID=A0ABS9VNF9_9SPHN|nr:hypothetical protein [Sphingomonas telluris]MCH8616514.1 hypothetical protein [Sphingomonas telluris]
MSTPRKLRIVLLAAIVAIIGSEAANDVTGSEVFSLISSPAEARVGRPLTPVSVAGVARRTARRCAAGVYYC